MALINFVDAASRTSLFWLIPTWIAIQGATFRWQPTICLFSTRLRKYRTWQEAIADIREYIEVFYNRQRRHASLGKVFLTPVNSIVLNSGI